jgi:FtsP/CotA-like multicopper oxidase with cupredoxin domain
MPDTGVTKTYDFTVSYQTIAPDGVTKNGLVVNGGFPGPLVEANWGDWIQVTVTNNLTDEGTSIHWHGLLQKSTPWFDGVPSVGQCPIAPGSTMTYLFRADVYGTSWYHSHYSAQYAGGALGPMVINGPETVAYDIDVGPVMLSDWYHQDYFTLVNETMNGVVPASNNNLINGKMNYPCANTTLPCTPNAGISKFQFQSGKKHRLRLINTSAEGIQKFSIDNHTFTVIANDFVPINPYTTNVITLGVGQRSDVIVSYYLDLSTPDIS